ncbi:MULTISPECIES: methionine ABC transporter ATP-binding protein [Nosocomiicoccus]|uniref:methionine ABC transporter ATP-binding protein n=1 Tax=Nosocomiicoccus TaxID=489909 RepID=UPI00083265EB|nr:MULTISPECIES: ATP-binding cassette domain-containing protein [Nosocomiicoccus]OFS63117.1 phosphate ABC transporter ATP-binding protein [Nosocomiicoccus sp. HMSC09A07]
MIQIENVSKTFNRKGVTTEALKNVSLDIKEGEIYGIVGFSGAGKSTLLRTINHLTTPTSGEVIVDGKHLKKANSKEIREIKKDIGMIFQHFNLLNSKTVFKNVAMPLILSGTPKEEIEKRVNELLDFVGLKDKAQNYPDELSGGQKQRIGIARALATQPKILLCDEATSALDPETTASILSLLKRVNEEYNITILLITHEMSVVREICDKVAIMENGEVIESGSVFDIFSNPSTRTGVKFVNTVMHSEVPDFVLRLLSDDIKRHIYRLNFIADSAGQPVLSQLSKRYDVEASVLFGNITELQRTPFGNLIVEFIGEAEEIEKVKAFLTEQEVLYSEVTRNASEY